MLAILTQVKPARSARGEWSFIWEGKVEASVARRLRAPPEALMPQELKSRFPKDRLRGHQFTFSKVVIGNYVDMSF